MQLTSESSFWQCMVYGERRAVLGSVAELFVIRGTIFLTFALLEDRFFRTAFSARYAFVKTNHRTIAIMFLRLSVRLGWSSIVIIWCSLARI